MGALLAVVAGIGAYLLATSGLLLPSPVRAPVWRRWHDRGAIRDWMDEAGLAGVGPGELVAMSTALGAVAGLTVFAVFGGALAPILAAILAAGTPASAIRQRRNARRAAAQEAWPRMIEEIRILTSAAGRSIPQALFEAGRRAPIEMRDAFEAAHREWLLSTDFERTLSVLAGRLGDPTADATCETLLVAHVLGGRELDARLDALAEDRRLDLQGRKDARARQAGVRFARLFVLIVPAGMAVAGMAVGDGRAAFAEPAGQVAIVVALAIIATCWVWASRLMTLPAEQRVFRP